jgi:hypothetical protein
VGAREDAIARIKAGNATRGDYWMILGDQSEEEYADQELQNLLDGFIDSMES